MLKSCLLHPPPLYIPYLPLISQIEAVRLSTCELTFEQKSFGLFGSIEFLCLYRGLVK